MQLPGHGTAAEVIGEGIALIAQLRQLFAALGYEFVFVLLLLIGHFA